MSSGSGFVAVLVIHLHFPGVASLKGKRKDVSSIKSQLHGRFGVTVAEIDHQDLWQRATLTAALTGGSASRLSSAVDAIERWLEGRCPDGVRVERMLTSVDELAEVIAGFGVGG
jgi:hypothetical protein